MQHYRTTSHSVYDLKYHVVWITKYRKKVLYGQVAERLRDLIREICKAKDVEIIKGSISQGSRASFYLRTAFPFGEQAHTVAQGQNLLQAPLGVQGAGQTVLGSPRM